MNFTAEELRRLWLDLYRDEVTRLAQLFRTLDAGDHHARASAHAERHVKHFTDRPQTPTVTSDDAVISWRDTPSGSVSIDTSAGTIWPYLINLPNRVAWTDGDEDAHGIEFFRSTNVWGEGARALVRIIATNVATVEQAIAIINEHRRGLAFANREAVKP